MNMNKTTDKPDERRPSFLRTKWGRWIKVFLLLYCIIGIAFYYGQEALLFHPVAVDRNVKYDFGQPYTEVNLPFDKETNLNIIEFKATDHQDFRAAGESKFRVPDSLTRGVVLYFHGNRRNISWYAQYAADFTSKGYEVWMLDYPGFGKSTGKLSEQKLYDYALQLYKLARSRWQPSQIILYGKSLGTGIAAELASVRDCRRLILECPYYSLESVTRHYFPVYPLGNMLHYHFPTNSYLPAVTAPITIFHGSSDWLIPYSNAVRLKPLLKPGDDFITIEGGGHNDLHDFLPFRQGLEKLLAASY
jgi:pimeloyl-ACP methyl ester carboxylesterase